MYSYCLYFALLVNCGKPNVAKLRYKWKRIKQQQKELEVKYSVESTDPRESEIRAHLRP